MKPVWKMCLGIAMLSVVVLLFTTLPMSIAPTGRGPVGSSPGNQTDSATQSDGVTVYGPFVPDITHVISELPIITEEEPILDREINPRFGLGGSIDPDFAGGILGGVDPLLAVQNSVSLNQLNGFTTPILNFDGGGFSGVNPPDTVGDVGPDHYIQMINFSGGSEVRIYDKNGVLLAGPIALDTLGTGGNCANGLGDPIVLYDELADRWFLSEFSSSGNQLCVYISQTNDPITTSWYRYAFTAPNFPDYPKYGVWPDAYYVSSNEGNSPPVYALDRANMLAGQAATMQRFTGTGLAGFPFEAFTPADHDGDATPPANSPGYFMRHRDDESHTPGSNNPNEDYIEVWALDVNWVTPASSTFMLIETIPVAEFDSSLCGLVSFSCVPQPGTSTQLDPLREVVMFRLQYRNFGTHEVLVGNYATDVNGADRAGVRWFELRKSGAGSWSLFQEGTYAPGTDNHGRWMGAIAMDGSGNIALGYNVSSSTQFPSLRYVGRLASDPPGTMPQGEALLVAGVASNASNRYGDYAAMSVDPADDCTFWFTGEYNAASQWSTRIGTFRFDECGAPDFTLSVTPESQAVCVPASTSYALTVGQVMSYTDGVTLSALGVPTGYNASFTNNPVTPPGSSTMNLTNTGAAASGSYSINIVGVAPTSTHTTTVQLNLFTSSPGAAALLLPANGATDVSLTPNLSWTAVANATAYNIQIATDMGFTNIVYTATAATNAHGVATPLNLLTTYYWRVRAGNICGDGSYSTPFSFTTRDIPPILLVDDDDNAPDTRGTYTDALDALGLDYDIWDTANTNDEPALNDLAPYRMVIWFTGDEFGGFAGPGAAGETALGTWLDAGNCLFLSSQDYLFDRLGSTVTTPNAFMSTYLGLATLAHDTGDYTSVNGAGSVFGTLGNMPLSYSPMSDFSDRLTPDATAEVAMVGNNSFNGAINKDSGIYKTTFWGFPLEAIASAANEQAALSAFVSWCEVSFTVTPDSYANVPPGTTVIHEFILANLDVTDTYTLTLTPGTWTTTLLTPSPVIVTGGSTTTLQVQVQVPATVNAPNETDEFFLTVQSSNDPSQVKIVNGETESSPYVAGVTGMSHIITTPGTIVTHTFTLENFNWDDSYTLAVSGNSWTTMLVTGSPVAVANGGTVTIEMRVEVPNVSTPGSDQFTLTVTSVNAPTLILTAVGMTDVELGMTTIYLPLMMKP